MRMHRMPAIGNKPVQRSGAQQGGLQRPTSSASPIQRRSSNHCQQNGPHCGDELACSSFEIGRADDPFEREADQVADRVMNQQTATVQAGAGNAGVMLQRMPDSPYSLADGEIAEEEAPVVQAKAADGGSGSCPACHAADHAVTGVLQQSGQHLAPDIQRDMEAKFSQDFSKVRVHTGQQANTAARAVQARAFTNGMHIVFANGQYRPDERSGQHLLAHELTHVVQQGASQSLGSGAAPGQHTAVAGAVQRKLDIHQDSTDHSLRRVKWGSAVDSGADAFPWGRPGPKGDVFQVETNAGTQIKAWRPHDNTTYWCHGFTFGGSKASGGPFSLWGEDVPTVLQDDGWQHTYGCMSQRKDILVFSDSNVAHSGVISNTDAPGAKVDEQTSMLNSKWGSMSQNISSWLDNATQYGKYEAYSKKPLTGVCDGRGPNER